MKKAQKRLNIGLLGGSFNPAHEGHRAISLLAMKRLQLDFVWWLVSPQNPLKSAKEMQPLETRLIVARKTAHHPRIKVTALETQLKTRYTIDTVKAIKKRFSHRFVWLMGADNLRQFHRWKDWRGIAQTLPICVIDRPDKALTALSCPAAQSLKPFCQTPAKLMRAPRPAVLFLSGVKNKQSSTGLRAAQKNV